MKKLFAFIFIFSLFSSTYAYSDVVPSKPVFKQSDHCVIDPSIHTVVYLERDFKNGSLISKYGIGVLYKGYRKILTSDLIKYQQADSELKSWSPNFAINLKVMLPEDIYKDGQCGTEKYEYEKSLIEYNTPDGSCTNFWLYPNKTKYEYEVVGESYRDMKTLYSLLDSNTTVNYIGEREFYTKAVLKPEPNNKVDKYAVMVLINDKHVGYVPKDFSKYVTQYIKLAKKKSISVPACMGSGHDWPQVNLNMEPFLKSIKKNIIAWRDGERSER